MSRKMRDSVWDRHGVIRSILEPVRVPRMAKVRQLFPDQRLADVAGAVRRELARPGIGDRIRPAMRVAVTVGSRGIANLPAIVRAVVAGVKDRGGLPFVFPAMGSHGGATAQGQSALLEALGITEASVGAPIRSGMETVVVGHTERGQEVHLDRCAAEADGIIVLNRVKPHTAFRGDYESGLMKMMAIGMGNQKGAECCHAQGFARMAENIPRCGKVVLEQAGILFGLAVLENAFDTTCRIEAVPKAEIATREPELLREAKALMPRILIRRFDVLVVDRIGKNFSGSGADPNITGTYCTYCAGADGPEFQRYVVLDLSEETHGSALGVGMADITTRRLFDQADFDACYPNSLTYREPRTVKMPMVMASDRLALQAAIFTCVDLGPEGPRIVRLANTAHIGEIQVSEALLPEVRETPGLELLEAPAELPFSAGGDLW
jgi:hypothetical protein